MRETIRGHDIAVSESLKVLADEKAGGIDKISFYPKESNPYKNKDGFKDTSTVFYNIG